MMFLPAMSSTQSRQGLTQLFPHQMKRKEADILDPYYQTPARPLLSWVHSCRVNPKNTRPLNPLHGRGAVYRCHAVSSGTDPLVPPPRTPESSAIATIWQELSNAPAIVMMRCVEPWSHRRLLAQLVTPPAQPVQ